MYNFEEGDQLKKNIGRIKMLTQNTRNRQRNTEHRKQTEKHRRQKTEDGRRKTEDGAWNTEHRTVMPFWIIFVVGLFSLLWIKMTGSNSLYLSR